MTTHQQPDDAVIGELDGATAPLQDDSIAPDDADENPYPGADNRAWTERFSAALAADSGLPRDITDRVAPFVVMPKQYLVQGRGSAPDTLRPSAIKINNTGHRVLTVFAHGFAGNAGEYNERIRTSYPSPVTPRADLTKTLPALTTGRTGTGELAPFITTTAPVDPARINTLLGVMSQALDDADGNRGYDLAEDIEIYGQQETTLHVVLVRQVAEPADDGGTRIRTVVDLTAVKGANRSRARLQLFGLSPEAIVFGVKPKTVMGMASGAPETPIADPRIWVPQMANALKAAWADPSHPGHMIARRAQQIATVQLDVIIGGDPLEDFHNHVFDPNRVDHRRPPLDYQPRDKAASDLRALLRDYKAQGVYTEAERAWLAGEGPDPAPVPGESVVDARDRRDRALLDVVFPPRHPGSVALWPRARIVLGEPPRSQAGRRQVDARARMFSAVSSDAYRARWNPRVLDALFPGSAIREQTTFHHVPSWAELAAQFEAGDHSGLHTFVMTRGMHWLAEYGLVDADRGSTEAQGEATGEGGEERARFVRRTMINIRTALLDKPQKAAALFNELAAAAEAGAWPRTVDDDGNPVPDSQATRVWFNEAFPKVRRPVPPIEPEDPPEQPPPSPQQQLLQAQEQFFNATTDTLMTGIVTVYDAGRELVTAAAAAGHAALPDGSSPVTEAVERACAAAMTDVQSLMSLLPQLKYGEVPTSKFEDTKCGNFLDAAAD